MSDTSIRQTDQASPDAASADTPFLCQKPVRVTIYAFFVLFLLSMLAFRFLPRLFDPTFEKHIARGEVMVGMTRQQVLAAWGSPYTINVTYTKDGIRR
ncbi:MAG: hypothetical protein ACREI9_08085, partial [Nitrospiraceae bacterium]